MHRRNWTREELILAMNLYCKLPFGKMHKGNLEVISLSRLINRTPSSVAWKLGNFASLDPTLQKRGIVGAINRSKLDEEIWNEFIKDWENLGYESEKLLAKYRNKTVEESSEIIIDDWQKEGKERETIVKERVNQNLFRKTILASYSFKCCITGISHPDLLVASHIVPWSVDVQNRLNPRNGLCMNALHDRAFDKGLITVSDDFKIVVSKFLKDIYIDKSIKKYFKAYENRKIILPSKFLPGVEFLQFHQTNIFTG